MSDRETMQQALEALENIDRAMPFPVGKQVIAALREALAQPEQEPTCPKCKAVVLYECVACSNNNYPPKPEQEPSQWREMVVVTLVREGINKHRARELADHFAAQPAQEPVAYYHPRNGFYWAKPTSIFAPTSVDVERLPLYTAAQRPWVGLEPKEILDLFDVNNVYGSKWIEFARAIEAALRSKNT